MTDAIEIRHDLANFLHRDLIGPADGEKEVLEDTPRIRYLAGVLFPQELMRNESDSAGGIESSDTESNEIAQEDECPLEPEEFDASPEVASTNKAPESEYDDTLTLANSYRPSAMGLSFFLSSNARDINVDIRAAEYESKTVLDLESGRKRAKWYRKPIPSTPIPINLKDERYFPTHDWDIAPGLKLKGVFRHQKNGQLLVTLSLYNTTKSNQKDARTFYQSGFRVKAKDDSPIFVEYRTAASQFRDAEEASLALLYRNRRNFAVGHGCAANWAENQPTGTNEIRTTTLPNMTVPPVNPVSHPSQYLDMDFLRGNCDDPSTNIIAALNKFCESYEEWVEQHQLEIEDLVEYDTAPESHIALCKNALSRMRAGIEMLKSNKMALEAFQLTNRVMLMQQHHARLRRELEDPWAPLPSSSSDYSSDWSKRRGFWRTFQIAFILINLPGLTSENSETMFGDENINERELVDLIWFPTGGGKTEAYLGLAAYVIFLRRLAGLDDKGCKILMRYTLRLLTSQQFQRAASLICACEIVRREAPDLYGETPITIGLFVGQSLTPNLEKVARKAIGRMARKGREEKNPFQLLHCPWCGTELNNEKRFGYTERRNRMIFQCPSRPIANEPGCPFSERSSHLPVCVVDESIYKNPPTLLIGTVDKFAMLAWRAESGSILTLGGGPDLIIQDELHLISGPLGSIVGLYEGVFEYLWSKNGMRPKIVASTATIRRADEQCRALYNRQMFQFPPPGLDASDSFFAKEDLDAPGRLYLGFLPSAASSPLTAQIRAIVAMQQGILLISDNDTANSSIDPYWTLVQYFGSLKELGHAATFVTADIPEFLPTMHRRFKVPPERKRWMRNSEELTSRKNADEIPKILQKLELKYDSEAKPYEQALDTLLATSMISVGVDVDRLGLMMVVTQPKGTSEYIQASSRVGRSDNSPGLVLTLYNAARPRDRSHYEYFCGYHKAYYRYVEPTSVTPFSPPAMQRALHAILIIAGRHIAKWESPKDFSRSDKSFVEFLSFFRKRVEEIDSDHLLEYDSILESRLEEWESRPVDKWGDFDTSAEDPVLMRPAGRPPRENDLYSWETPTSMRNVDVECQAAIFLPRTLLSEDDG